MSEKRKLTTVLFADIAGYSALMQKDEKLALHLLNRFKTIFEDTIRLHKGEIIQYFGDGCLLTFNSGTNGTECAIALQLAFRAEDIPVRIGMHLGDVVFKNQNAFGDGVNIASRIESLGIPGVVLLSKTVRNQIKNKSEFKLVSLGKFDFKNVDEPVEVYAIANDGMVIPKRREMKGKVKQKFTNWHIGKNVAIYIGIAWVLMEAFNFLIERYHWEPLFLDILIIFLVFGVVTTIIYNSIKGRWNIKAIILQVAIILSAFISTGYFIANPTKMNPRSLRPINLSIKKSPLKHLSSVAVLPIQNNLPNGEKNYLLAGLHDGIITELGKLGSIKVISRTSTLPFANTSESLRRIGSELNVKTLLESSLTPSSDWYVYRVRLLDSKSEELLWSDEFKTTPNELPLLVDEASKLIAAQLNPEVVENVKIHEDINPDAFQEVAKGNHLLQKFTMKDISQSINHYKKAIELDSSNIEGYLGVAKAWIYLQQISCVDPKIARPNILKYGDIAMKMDPDHWQTYNYSGTKAFLIDYEFETGIQLLEKSIELNPNDSGTRSLIAHFYMLVNDWDKAWEQIRYAKEIDPLNPQVLSFEALMNFAYNRFLSGIKLIKTISLLDQDNGHVITLSVIKNRDSGKSDESIESMKRLYEDQTNNPIALNKFIDQEYARTKDVNLTWLNLIKHLKKSGYQQYYPGKTARILYSFLSGYDDDLFFECMEQMAKDRHPDMPYFAMKDGLPIQDDPRYINIMKDLELW